MIIAGRNVETLEHVKQSLLEEHTGRKVDSLSIDVTDESSVVNFFQNIQQNYGGVDLLVNNAGISIAGDAESLSADQLRKVLDVNVTGAFLCSREALKQMKTKEGGRIINIGSISAYSPRPNSVAYTTSKFALDGLTKSLSLDARDHNIAVGVIQPGNVMSQMLSAEEVERRSKLEGFMDPSDVADCVLTMASLPYSTNLLEMTVIPTTMPFVGRG